MIPPHQYEEVRKYMPMGCEDVVHVLDTPIPSTPLLWRNDKTVAPNTWWITGGMVQKDAPRSLTCVSKTKSEISIDLNPLELRLIGMGVQRFIPNASDHKYDSRREWPIVTHTHVYAARIAAQATFVAGDGNEKATVFTWDQIKGLDLHPYVRNCIIAGFDEIHGKDWRPADLKSYQFPQNEDFSRVSLTQ